MDFGWKLVHTPTGQPIVDEGTLKIEHTNEDDCRLLLSKKELHKYHG